MEYGAFIKPPAWFLGRTQGWIPREHSYSPWCAPTSWSGLSPRGAEVKGHKAGREGGKEISEQHGGRGRRREGIMRRYKKVSEVSIAGRCRGPKTG